MEITITARRTPVSEAVRLHTEEKLERLERFERRPTHAEILFDAERAEKKVEIRVVVAGGGTFLAQGTAGSYRAAVDAAVERLTRQLKREHERVVDHQASKLTP
jgi:ribosomal subunit interface protein